MGVDDMSSVISQAIVCTDEGQQLFWAPQDHIKPTGSSMCSHNSRIRGAADEALLRAATAERAKWNCCVS